MHFALCKTRRVGDEKFSPTKISFQLIITLFLLTFSFTFVRCQSANDSSSNGADLERKYVQNALNLVKEYKESVREKLWQVANRSEEVERSLVSEKPEVDKKGGCLKDLRAALGSSVDKPSFEWLIQMYDSSGSLPSGLLSGTTTSLGDFEQCLHVPTSGFSSSQNVSNDQLPFTSDTQYCLLTLRAQRGEDKFTSLNFGGNLSSNEDISSLTDWEREHLQKWLVTDNKVPIAVGLCLPKSCTEAEKLLIGRAASTLTSRFESKVGYCQASKNSQNDLWDFLWEKFLQLWPALLVLSGLAGAVALGTFLDYLTETKFGQNWSTELNLLPVKLIRCFSLVKNTKMLYDVRGRGETKNATGDKKKQTNGASKSRSKENNNLNSLSNTVVCTSAEKRRRAVSLDILDGIRVFTILWIIAAHCSSMTQIPVLMKISPLAHFPWTFFENRDANWLVSSYLLSTYYPVSIFFMVSGILVIYSRQKTSKCDTKAHFVRHLMTRLFRLLPTLLATMGMTYYLRYLGTGPLFHQDLVEPYVAPCKTHFWSHLFLVHNFLPIDQRCGSHTWYVGADFQLNMLAFVVVHLIRCRSRWFIGILLAMALVTVSGLIPLILAAGGLGPIPNFNVYVDPRINIPMRDLILFYYASYIHANAFFMGVILGYVLSSGWDFNFLIKNKLTRFIWLNFSSSTVMAVPLAMRYFVFPNDEQNSGDIEERSPFTTAFLFQFFACTFNFAMACFIFIMALNPTLYISQFLSGRVFRPLSRMVFSAYLSHQVFIWFSIQQARAPFVISVFSLCCFIAMNVAVTIMASIGLYLLVECPFMRVSKLLFSNESISSDEQSKKHRPLKMHSISTVESAGPTSSSYSSPPTAPSSSPPLRASVGGGDQAELQSIIVRQTLRSPDLETVTDASDSDATGLDGGEPCLPDQNNNSRGHFRR